MGEARRRRDAYELLSTIGDYRGDPQVVAHTAHAMAMLSPIAVEIARSHDCWNGVLNALQTLLVNLLLECGLGAVEVQGCLQRLSDHVPQIAAARAEAELRLTPAEGEA